MGFKVQKVSNAHQKLLMALSFTYTDCLLCGLDRFGEEVVLMSEAQVFAMPPGHQTRHLSRKVRKLSHDGSLM